jgi:hypothetical protein
MIKSENVNLLNWNQELRLSAEIRSAEKNIDILTVSDKEKGKRRPDIWFYNIKEDKTKELIEKKFVCNLIEVSIS